MEGQPIYTRSYNYISEGQELDAPSHKKFKASVKIAIVQAKIQGRPNTS
jgi:hypothetical protein